MPMSAYIPVLKAPNTSTCCASDASCPQVWPSPKAGPAWSVGKELQRGLGGLGGGREEQQGGALLLHPKQIQGYSPPLHPDEPHRQPFGAAPGEGAGRCLGTMGPDGYPFFFFKAMSCPAPADFPAFSLLLG